MQMGHYDLLHTVRESAAALRTSLLESLASQRAQRAEGWERDRREWLESVREIGNNWRSELAGEIHRTRAEIGEAVDASSAARRRAASDMYLALPCESAGFPAAGTKVIVDTLKKRAEKLGPLKAAALKQVLHLNDFFVCLHKMIAGAHAHVPKQDGDVCSICLELMNAGDEAISLPACHHIFHWACLSPWLERKGADSDCPFCKRKVLPELTKEENKWAIAVVERQLARDRERERALLRQQQRETERDAHDVLRVLYDAHEPPPPTHSRRPQAFTQETHTTEAGQGSQVRVARAIASRQQGGTDISRSAPTRLSQNLARISQQANAGLLDLDAAVAGTLDIDWDSSSVAGICLSLSAFPCVLRLSLSASSSIPCVAIGSTFPLSLAKLQCKLHFC